MTRGNDGVITPIYVGLCFDLVFAAEHIVHTLKIVDTLGYVLNLSGWGKRLLEMSLLAELAILDTINAKFFF